MLRRGRNSEKLNRQLVRGELSALKYLYELHWQKIFNVAYGLLKSKEDAEELVQDVFLKLWDYRVNIDKNRSLEGLLITIAKRETLNKLRKKASHFLYEEIHEYDACDDVTDQQIAGNELLHLSEDAINSLPPKRRMIFNLRLHQGLTNKEIAENLGVSIKFVERQISMARRSLEEQLKVNGYSGFVLLFFTLFY